jgi:hypothetical protein
LRIRLICQKCIDWGVGDQATPPKVETYWAELSDKNIYSFTCSNGHETHASLQEHRFELLVDVALWALASDFPDLAILRFYSALEVFQSFFISCILFNKGIDQDIINRVQKDLKQAEARKGAFISMFLVEKSLGGDATPELPDLSKLVETRNRIAHAGYIPSMQEAEDYGQKIINFIIYSINWMQRFCSTGIDKAVNKHISDNAKLIREQNPGLYPIQFMAIPTICSLTVQQQVPPTVSEAITCLRSSGAFARPAHK